MRSFRARLASAVPSPRRTAAVLAVLLGLCGALALPGPAAPQTAGICDRTLQVQDEIVRSLPGVGRCSEVTSTHLEGITALSLSAYGMPADKRIYSLKSGDFAGLSNLETLNLRNNQMTRLPTDLFKGLSNLQNLNLMVNRLTSLPAGLFNGLSNLHTLNLSDNQLSSLPAGLFNGLSNLHTLDLSNNKLSSLPTNLFRGLSRLKILSAWTYRRPDLYLDLTVERVGSGSLTQGSPVTLRANVAQGAPKDISVTWEATALSGLVNGKKSASGTVNIGVGNTGSRSFTVTGALDVDGKAPVILVRITSPKFGDVVVNVPGLRFSAPGAMRLDFGAGSALSRATIHIAGAEALEGEVIEFPVRLSQAASSDVTLNWAIAHGTSGSNDFTAASGALTIKAGALSGVVEVPTVDDLTPEAYETFTVALSAPAGGLPEGVVMGTESAKGTIQNDDTRITIKDSAGQEGGYVKFETDLSHPIEFGPTLRLVVSHGTTEDADFDPSGLRFQSPDRSYVEASFLTTKVYYVAVPTSHDDKTEGDEVFHVTLGPASGGLPKGIGITFVNEGRAIGTIRDFSRARVSIADTTGDEGGVFRFPVTMDKAVDSGVCLNWHASYKTALSSDVFTRSAGRVNIPAGQTSATIVVHTRQDELPEPVEIFTVTIDLRCGQPWQPATVMDDTAVGTILNEDAAITIDDAEAKEGDVIVFTVHLDQAVSEDVTLRWRTANDPGATAATTQAPGTGATVRTDYRKRSARVTILKGKIEGKIRVETIEDSDDEADETFKVVLREPPDSEGGFPAGLSLTLADAEALGTIRNDDASSISIADARAVEGGNLTFTVSLGEPWGTDVAINWSLRDDTATAPADYPANQSGSFTIAAGLVTGTFTVRTAEDQVAEGDETLKAVIAAPTAKPWPHQLRVADAEALGTIVDDDTATVSIGNAAASEGAAVAFAVRLDKAADEDVTLSWRTHDGSAVAPGDYDAESAGSVTVPAGRKSATLEVLTAEDTVTEAAETFRVVLSAPAAGLPPRVALGDTEATGTIRNSAAGVTLTATVPDNGGTTDTVSEDDGKQTVTVTATLNGRARFGRDRVVWVSAGSGTATEGTDFTTTGEPFGITIPAGRASATGTFELDPAEDTLLEGTETVAVSGVVRQFGATAADRSVTVAAAAVNIADTTAAPKIVLTVAPGSVAEGADPTAPNVTVTATIDGSTTWLTPKAVTVVVDSGTAVEGTDFASVADFAITIPAGASSATGKFKLDPVEDVIDEGAGETVSVTGSTVANDTVDATEVTITDNDAAPTKIVLTVDPGSVAESANPTADNVTVTATVTGGTVYAAAKAVTVVVGSGTAVEGTDFASVADFAITIPAGASSATGKFKLDPVEDVIDEGAGETVSVTGSTVANDGGVATVDATEVTITDNDAAPTGITLTVDPGSVAESANPTADNVTVTATVTGGTVYAAPKAVTVVVGSGTAVEGTDFASVADFAITIPAGASSATGKFKLDPVEDVIDEGAGETVSVTGSTVANDTVDATEVTITDNDAAPTKIVLTVDPGSVAESANPTADNVTVTATVTGGTVYAAAKAVTVVVDSGTAVEGTDFASVADFAITIPAGASSATGKFKGLRARPWPRVADFASSPSRRGLRSSWTRSRT